MKSSWSIKKEGKKEGSDWGENIPTYFNSIIGNGQRSLQIVSEMLGDTNEELLIMHFDIDYLKKAIKQISCRSNRLFR